MVKLVQANRTELAESAVLRSIREWLKSRRVPKREVDILLLSISNFFDSGVAKLEGHHFQMAASATGRLHGQVHINIHVTWENLQLEEPHFRLMRELSEGFTAQVPSLPEKHVLAHLMWVPKASYRKGRFKGFVRDYAEKESLAFCGVW